jgi:hypothetical protein
MPPTVKSCVARRAAERVSTSLGRNQTKRTRRSCSNQMSLCCSWSKPGDWTNLLQFWSNQSTMWVGTSHSDGCIATMKTSQNAKRVTYPLTYYYVSGHLRPSGPGGIPFFGSQLDHLIVIHTQNIHFKCFICFPSRTICTFLISLSSVVLSHPHVGAHHNSNACDDNSKHLRPWQTSLLFQFPQDGSKTPRNCAARISRNVGRTLAGIVICCNIRQDADSAIVTPTLVRTRHIRGLAIRSTPEIRADTVLWCARVRFFYCSFGMRDATQLMKQVMKNKRENSHIIESRKVLKRCL